MTDAELREYEDALAANPTSVDLRCIVGRARWARSIDGAIFQSIGMPLGVPAPRGSHVTAAAKAMVP